MWCSAERLMMNTQIKEIMGDATLLADSYFDRDCAAWRQIYSEKLAELIVAHATECLRDVLRDETSDLSYTAASQVQARIKEYFGIES
jgi:hypothetical protein